MMSRVKLSCLTAAAILLVWSSVSPAPVDRSYVSGNCALSLDGKNCGFVKSAEGGAITGEVVKELVAPGSFVKKHLGQLKYEEFTVQVGFGMAKPLYDWISQSWTTNPQRKNGSLIAANFDLQAQSEQQFSDAMITATTIPTLDGANKDPSYLSLTFAPAYIRNQKAEGKLDAGASALDAKVFVSCNFRLEIDGLDCSKVSRIDSFTVKQTLVTDDVGNAGDQIKKEPGRPEFPNLRIAVAETAAQSFKDWHESFVVQGKNDQASEKNGTLSLLSADRQQVLARIKFFNLGIFRLQPDKTEANADSIKRVIAELYVERMEFECTAANAGTAPATTPTITPTRTPTSPTNLSPIRRG